MTTPPTGIFVGLSVLDLVHYVDRLPLQNEKVTAKQQSLAAGGPCANAAITFAALGGRARLITALGSSTSAQLARRDLESHGVEVIDLAPDSFDLSVSAVAVIEGTGDRSITSLDGGRAVVPATGIAEHFIPAHTLLIDGHHPELARAALMHYSGSAAERIMDAGRWKPHFTALMPHTDTVICSADFAVPAHIPSTKPVPIALTDQLIVGELFSGTNFARTAGHLPITWWQRSSAGTQSSGLITPPHITAVDTLGAGDVFHGAYAYYAAVTAQSRTQKANSSSPNNTWFNSSPGNVRNAEQDFATALTKASRIAAHRVQTLGPRSWIPTLDSNSRTQPET